MAEGVGFEPTSPFGLPVFKTSAFDRSAIPPAAATVAEGCANGKRSMPPAMKEGSAFDSKGRF
jgi:hypothetical protein